MNEKGSGAFKSYASELYSKSASCRFKGNGK